MSKQFENKVVLITGGTSGIGRATAVAFAREGAKVVVSGRRKAEGAETVTLVEKAGGQGLFVQADVSDEEQVKKLVQTTVDHFGRLDVAFNNAGIEGAPKPLTEATPAEFDQVFNINVKGVFLSMKYEIPAMLKTGGGSIVNTSSIAGTIGMAGAGIYIASKHAVNGLTKTAALEVAKQGIRVNAVSPAAIQTDMLDRFLGDEQAEQKKQYFAGMHPVGRVGTSAEVASAVLYLSSPGASFITGHDLLVDGGFTVQ
ncbi:MAG TPA: SDR family oxidoreductase [Candidatus Methylacidiphilales bacterium]|jgi:NAD(P)-dependent dehydrogenase (short-subunit alcohol dehydrogenase family)|nr:SDR family oxidoreductase [Candidatus Methylacidiphilales bacterium]